MPARNLRRPVVSTRTGNPRATLYDLIANGLFTTPVPIGGRAVGWPEHEVDAIVYARSIGCTDATIRQLVSRLMANRAAELERQLTAMESQP